MEILPDTITIIGDKKKNLALSVSVIVIKIFRHMTFKGIRIYVNKTSQFRIILAYFEKISIAPFFNTRMYESVSLCYIYDNVLLSGVFRIAEEK